MRTLNSDGTRGELVCVLRGVHAGIKQAAKWLCEKVNEGSPKFMSKTLPVLVAVE